MATDVYHRRNCAYRGWRSSDKLLVADWKRTLARNIKHLAVPPSASSLTIASLLVFMTMLMNRERERERGEGFVVRNRFYGARGGNYAGMESRAMECEAVVVTIISHPSPSIFVYSVYIRAFFDERRERFSLSRRARKILPRKMKNRDRSGGNLVGWISATNLLT